MFFQWPCTKGGCLLLSFLLLLILIQTFTFVPWVSGQSAEADDEGKPQSSDEHHQHYTQPENAWWNAEGGCDRSTDCVNGGNGTDEELLGMMCPQECALPWKSSAVGRADWLVTVPFAPGRDPRNFTGAEGEVAMEFVFCQHSEGTASQVVAAQPLEPEECMEDGYAICYEGHLDPEREGTRLEDQVSVANQKQPGFLDKLCNEGTPKEAIGHPGMGNYLNQWAKEKEKPKHGLMVSQLGNGKFLVQTSFSGQQFHYNIGKHDGNGEDDNTNNVNAHCLHVRLFTESSPFTQIAVMAGGKQMDTESVQAQQTMAHGDIVGRVINGQRFADDELAGPWLLGLDMFARLPESSIFNLKLVKMSNKRPECVPRASFRSTALRDMAVISRGGDDEEMEEEEEE